MSTKTKGMLCALFGGSCWGLSGVVGKLLFDARGLNAVWLVNARLLLGGFILLVVAFGKEREAVFSLWRDVRSAASLVLFAIFGMAACQLAYFLCVQYSNPATGTVLQYTAPALILLFCLFWERRLPGIVEFLVLVAVVAGVFLMATHGDVSTLIISDKALLAGGIAAVTVVFYSIWPVRLMQRYGSSVVIGWGMFVGGILLVPFARFWEIPGEWDGMTFLWLAIVVIFGTVCAFSFYLKGVLYLGPVKTSLFACMEPLVSTVLTVWLLHQAFMWADILGIALILVGVTALAVCDAVREARVETEETGKNK